MFLLVPAYPGFPGQIPQSRKMVVCVCVCSHVNNQATKYASQHICCLSQARINWEGCARKGIWRKNGGNDRDRGTN